MQYRWQQAVKLRIMKKLILIAFIGFLNFNLVQAQVPFDEIIEDKQEMADSYYGTFKHKGEAYTGNAIAYHENGKIKTLRGYKDGKYHGMWTEWYSNGNRKFQGDRIENKGHGLTKWWYENGLQKKQGTYDMDIQQGVVVQWHPNGNLKQIKFYDKGNVIGGWVVFDENGTPIEEKIE